jgi:histone-lysine N-methyltransferase SETMAR
MRIPKSPDRPDVSNLGLAIAQLLDENPNLSTKQISEITGKHKVTVKDRLVYELGRRKVASKWIPHALTSSEKARRVQMAQELHDTLLQELDFGFEKIVTLDETWLPLVHSALPRWAKPGEARKEFVKRKTGDPQVMLTAVFSGQRMWLLSYMCAPLTMDSGMFIFSVVDKLDEEFTRKWGEKRETVLVHMDNAPAHRSKAVQARLLKMNATALPHPPYSPDLSPCDFWLFSVLKRHLKGFVFKDEQKMMDEANEFLTLIPQDELYRVFLNWIKRCCHVVHTGGEYIDKEVMRTMF